MGESVQVAESSFAQVLHSLAKLVAYFGVLLLLFYAHENWLPARFEVLVPIELGLWFAIAISFGGQRSWFSLMDGLGHGILIGWVSSLLFVSSALFMQLETAAVLIVLVIIIFLRDRIFKENP